MIPFKITKRNNNLKILAIGIARDFDNAIELAKKGGYPVTDFGVIVMARDAFNAAKERGKIPIITAQDELPEGPRLDEIIKILKKIRKQLKHWRGEGGCSVDELIACQKQINEVINASF